MGFFSSGNIEVKKLVTLLSISPLHLIIVRTFFLRLFSTKKILSRISLLPIMWVGGYNSFPAFAFSLFGLESLYFFFFYYFYTTTGRVDSFNLWISLIRCRLKIIMKKKN